MVVDVFDVHLFDLLSHMMAYLSLCLALLLYSGEELVSLVATECSTFVQINSGTSKRSWALPDGDPRVASVLRGNCLAACSALFILVICLLFNTFLLEQPGSSVLMGTHRMQWLLQVLGDLNIKIYRQSFWMGCWGHWSPKRSIIWSNNPVIRAFTTHGLAKRKNEEAGPPTTVRYVSKKTGKSGYSGSRHLKSTE